MALAKQIGKSVSRAPGRSKARSPAKADLKKRKMPLSAVINLRADEATRTLIDNAANILGQNRSEFMLMSSKVRAQEVLLSQTHFNLSDEVWDAFQADLAAPSIPTAELIALMSRTPLWSK